MRKPEAVPSSRMTATFVGRDMKEIRILLLLNSFQGGKTGKTFGYRVLRGKFRRGF